MTTRDPESVDNSGDASREQRPPMPAGPDGPAERRTPTGTTAPEDTTRAERVMSGEPPEGTAQAAAPEGHPGQLNPSEGRDRTENGSATDATDGQDALAATAPSGATAVPAAGAAMSGDVASPEQSSEQAAAASAADLDRTKTARIGTDAATSRSSASAAMPSADAGAGATRVGDRGEETAVLPSVDQLPSADSQTRAIRRPDDEAITREQARTDLATDDVPLRRTAPTAATTPAAVPASAVATDRGAQARRLKPARTTDRPLGAIAFFVLRVVTGLVIGIHGLQNLLHLSDAEAFFGSLPIPQGELVGMIVSIAEAAIGLMLILGLAVRVAGLVLLVIAVGLLVLVQWTVMPNVTGRNGFKGELELLLAACGFVFFLLGGGSWGLDKLFRRRDPKPVEDV